MEDWAAWLLSDPGRNGRQSLSALWQDYASPLPLTERLIYRQHCGDDGRGGGERPLTAA